MIKKTNRGWEVLSEKKHKCMGIYKSKGDADKRLKQLETFKAKFLKGKK